ncbi:HNH endonuclease [Psychrobacter sp. Pi2-52]|uniref:HNH endonuclease n=1 Tax=Psychrobacter sp. Pi2-52 TaxID=2774133 RepID=UPI00191894D8|nr:HNH endonuclease [Psychrobacter sp. Pi2-52]
MKQCYLCGLEFNDSSVKEHKEHIIQQAIGGNLTCKDILCESCGSKLNNDIDIEFNKIFEQTSVLLGIKRHRKDISKKNIKGKHQTFIPEIQEILDKRNIGVTWSNRKVYPNQPFEIYSEDGKEITIYSNSRVAKHFKKKVENDFKKQNPNSPLPKITICEDLYGLTFFDFRMDNYTFKQGLAKIAVNYASSHGIPRDKLELVLQIEENDKTAHFTNVTSVMFFHPLGIIDKLIEDKKVEFQPYPTHSLILFNSVFSPNVLVCYVELFSTYQYYVVLSNNYSGPSIHEFYTQKILPEEEVVFEPYRQYYKDRSSILSSLNISKEELINAYLNKSDSESEEQVECKLITTKRNERRYDISLEKYLEDIIDSTIFEKIHEVDNNTDTCSLNVIKELIFNLNLFFYTDENGKDIFSIESFRQYYINNEGKKVDYIDELFSKHKSILEDIKAYNHQKFYDLQRFHNSRNIDKKLSD